MEPELLPGVAKDQLNLVLSFFPRVDAKASVVLAVDTGMALSCEPPTGTHTRAVMAIAHTVGSICPYRFEFVALVHGRVS